MADKPSDKDLLPGLLTQNPSGVSKSSQDRIVTQQEQVDRILGVFKKLLGSNYVSDVPGPHYMLRFQTAAELIADFQITAQEAFADGFWEYTRPEFLFQILGLMVLPDSRTDGIPVIRGDLSYREFLRRMVELLLAGATKTTIENGLELLSPEVIWTVIERGIVNRQLGEFSGWDPTLDKFTFEISAENIVASVDASEVGVVEPDPVDIYGFPTDVDPFVLQENIRLVMKALKPAHTLYDFRFLFRDEFGTLFTDTLTWDLQSYYYDDLRKNCCGAKQITGTEGITWANRSLFSDTTREFRSVSPGAVLHVLTGPNSSAVSTTDAGYVGYYLVEEIMGFPGGDDATPRAYTTSPTALSGTATVSGMDIEDPDQTLFHKIVEGETLTFTEGPNAGTYRLKTVLGNNGGPVGVVTPLILAPSPLYTRLRIAYTMLRIRGWMAEAVTGQEYTVEVDRLGIQEPRVVIDEDVSEQFRGTVGSTNTLLTKRGPLVKGWGDGTPATPQDVSVTVGGVPEPIFDVNPYIGEITISFVAKSDPPPVVLVSYTWFASPIMSLVGLNTPGLVLNKWDLCGRIGHHPRFPMGVVLGPGLYRQAPPLISHRYLGYELEYSALLNSPTTLLLNQNPKKPAVPGFVRAPDPVAVVYEGTVTPTASPTRVWALLGTDAGGVNVGFPLAGTYTVTDNNAASYDPDDESAVVYYRGVDLSFPSSVSVVTRFFVVDDDSGVLNPKSLDPVSPDGVFTGVGFGVHNNKRLFLVGALLYNDVQHIGLLLDATRPEAIESWEIGPAVTITIQTATTATVPTAGLPTDLQVGDRFQILTGTQAGVYTITELTRTTECVTVPTTTLTVSPEFPANWKIEGSRDVTATFEALWSTDPSTYRLDVDPENGVAQVLVSGTTVGTIATISSAPGLPLPANTSLLLNAKAFGQVFWGSLSREATSSSTWSFVRYNVAPDETAIRDRRISVIAEMDTLPEDETAPWALAQAFGYSEIDGSGNALLLKSTSADDSGLDLSYGYSRVEMFLTRKATLDLRSIFRVESGTLGAGDGQIVIKDGEREVRLSTLLYYEGFPAGEEYRQLTLMPSLSFTGLMDPTEQGWNEIVLGSPTTQRRQQRFTITQGSGEQLIYTQTLDLSGLPYVDTGGRLFEGRFAVASHTGSGTDTGIFIQASTGANRLVSLFLREPTGVELHDGTGAVVATYAFNWDDGEFHTYRVIADQTADVVAVYLDDTLKFPTKTLTGDFPAGGSPNLMQFGQDGKNDPVTSTVVWTSVHCHALPRTASKRTLGIYLGGDPDHIDSWELPRTDSSTAPNSAQFGPVIEEMDWRSDIEVRMLRDPTWGVTIYRPDLPLPPYYASDFDPDLGHGQGFIVDTTEPSAGWINVEWAQLPYMPVTFGKVEFGALDPRSLSQQRWDRVSYLLFSHPTEDYRAPRKMVLNRYNIVSSGELSKDVTTEQVEVPTISLTELSLLPTHLFADRVFLVVDGLDTYTPDQFTFETGPQLLSLLPDEGGDPREFSAVGATVTVVFAPGKPVTNTYLLSQPLQDGVTLLNEDTPPVPKSQSVFYDRYVVYGPDILGDPPVDQRLLTVDALTPSNVLTDPYRVHVFRDGDDPATALFDSLYENMQFYEIQGAGTEGIISSICEGMLPLGETGYDPDLGEEIMTPIVGGGGYIGTGTYVGEPYGGFVLNLSGTLFEEEGFVPQSTLGGDVGIGWIWSGDGIDGTLFPPGVHPISVWEPVQKNNNGSSVVLVLEDTTFLTTETWTFVE